MTPPMTRTRGTRDRLVRHGVLLFLVGLLMGMVTYRLPNPRMGLSAHVGAAMAGIFVIALGAAWDTVALAPGAERAAVWLVLFGSWGSSLSVFLAALLDTRDATPIHGAATSAAARASGSLAPRRLRRPGPRSYERRMRIRQLIAAALAAALALALPAAAHAGRKSTLTARVGGKKFTSSGRIVYASYKPPFFLVSGTVRKGTTVLTIALACLIFELPTQFPFQCEGNSNFQEVSTRPARAKGWGTTNGMHLTLDQLDGSRARGTFSVAYDFSTVSSGPPPPLIAVQNGKFDAVVRH